MSEFAHRDADVFVSYSSHDRQRVLDVVRELQLAGVSTWLDFERIDGATIWTAEIVRAIRSCKLVLLMCSDASMRSWAVGKEIQLAGKYQKRLLPALLEMTSFPEQMEFILAGINCVEILNHPTSRWLPLVLRSLRSAGVHCGAHRIEESDGPDVAVPAQLDWSLEGIRSIAKFTDQLWTFSAERELPQPNRSLSRGLGEAPDGARHAFRVGTRIRIGIELEHDGHLVLIDEDPQGKRYCLCPSHFARNPQLMRGVNYLPQARSGFDAFVLTSAPGKELLLALVTDEPLNLAWLPSDFSTPARMLTPADIEELMQALSALPIGSWNALCTYFDVLPDV